MNVADEIAGHGAFSRQVAQHAQGNSLDRLERILPLLTDAERNLVLRGLGEFAEERTDLSKAISADAEHARTHALNGWYSGDVVTWVVDTAMVPLARRELYRAANAAEIGGVVWETELDRLAGSWAVSSPYGTASVYREMAEKDGEIESRLAALLRDVES
jgi:hypothetical protein